MVQTAYFVKYHLDVYVSRTSQIELLYTNFVRYQWYAHVCVMLFYHGATRSIFIIAISFGSGFGIRIRKEN